MLKMKHQHADFLYLIIAGLLAMFALSLNMGWLAKLAAMSTNAKGNLALTLYWVAGIITFLKFFAPVHRAGVKPWQYIFAILGAMILVWGILLTRKTGAVSPSPQTLKTVFFGTKMSMLIPIVVSSGILLTILPMTPSIRRAMGGGGR